MQAEATTSYALIKQNYIDLNKLFNLQRYIQLDIFTIDYFILTDIYYVFEHFCMTQDLLTL